MALSSTCCAVGGPAAVDPGIPMSKASTVVRKIVLMAGNSMAWRRDVSIRLTVGRQDQVKVTGGVALPVTQRKAAEPVNGSVEGRAVSRKAAKYAKIAKRSEDTGQHIIRQRLQFLARRWLDFNGIAIHEVAHF